jgi:acyl-CoA thioesterase
MSHAALNAFYELNGATAVPSAHTRGPWDPNAQHGGAPAALIAWTVDNLPSSTPMRLARLTIDLIRPVPIAPIEIHTDILREGRNIQLASVRLAANGKECVRATALRLRASALDIPAESAPPALRWPRPSECTAFENAGREGLAGSIEFRPTRADWQRGLLARADPLPRNAPPSHEPGGVWFRVMRPVIAGVETTPLMRAAITADFCNGMSGALDFRKWTFINADLTVHFARSPIGEWILLEAQGWIGSDGRGIAFGTLADEHGVFGQAAQSLVVAPR